LPKKMTTFGLNMKKKPNIYYKFKAMNMNLIITFSTFPKLMLNLSPKTSH
jgi:hypothetical protein